MKSLFLHLLVFLNVSILISCEGNKPENLKNHTLKDTVPYIDTLLKHDGSPTIYKEDPDSLVSLYNSLPSIKLHNTFFSLGTLRYSNHNYDLLFEEEAKLGAPDSVENIEINIQKKIINFGRGYLALNIFFIKDSSQDIKFAIITIFDANAGYGQDEFIYLLAKDSTLKWNEIKDIGFDKAVLFSKFTSTTSKTTELYEIFRVDYLADSNDIILKINQGRRHLCEQYPKKLICKIPDSKLQDSIMLKWSSETEKYIIANP